MTGPAQRHGGPGAGWYVPGPDGWRRIGDGEVRDHGDAAHFMSDPQRNPRAHHPLPPAEVGVEGRYLGRCSCGWRGQTPHSYEQGAIRDAQNHRDQVGHGTPLPA